MYKIFDPQIKLINIEEKNINNFPVLKFYFVRLTTTTLLPVEVTFYIINGEVRAVSPQENKLKIKDSGEFFWYRNDISFNKESIKEKLLSIPPVEKESTILDFCNKMLGIDLSSYSWIKAFKFDKILFVENNKIDSSVNYTSDGYYYIFTDIATESVKIGFYVGSLRPMTYEEFRYDVSAYGKDKIKNNVLVKQKGNVIELKNTSPFKIVVSVNRFNYSKTPLSYGKVLYTPEIEDKGEIILEPNSSFSFESDNVYPQVEYSLLQPLYYFPRTPFTNNESAYVYFNENLKNKPYSFEIKSVLLSIPTDDLTNYGVVTSLFDFANENYESVAIVWNDVKNISLKAFDGVLTGEGSTILNLASPEWLIEQFFKNIVSLTSININGDLNQLLYTIKDSEKFIKEIKIETLHNDVISENQAYLVFKIATRVYPENWMAENRKISYSEFVVRCGDEIDKINSGYEKLVENATKLITKNKYFLKDMFEILMEHILDTHPSVGYNEALKTFDNEKDAVASVYNSYVKSSLSNIEFTHPPIELKSEDIALFDVFGGSWESDEKLTNMAYRVRNHLTDLGIEIAVDELMRKLRMQSYVYYKKPEIVSIIHFGISMDGKWVNMGDNFFPTEEIENRKIAAINIDGTEIEYKEIEQGDFKSVYTITNFIGTSDSATETLELMKAVAVSLSTPFSLDYNLIGENPAIRELIKHAITKNDTSIPSSEYFNVRKNYFLFNLFENTAKNKYLFPNIIEMMHENDEFQTAVFTYSAALDKLKSLERLEIITKDYLLANISVLKELIALLKPIKYVDFQYFRIMDKDSNESMYINIAAKNINGVYLDVALSLVDGDEEILLFGYNVKTKTFYLEKNDDVILQNFPLMVAFFDLITHLNIKYYDGYSRYIPGVYYPIDENGEFITDVQPYFLYAPTLKKDIPYDDLFIGFNVTNLKTGITNGSEFIADKGYLDDLAFLNNEKQISNVTFSNGTVTVVENSKVVLNLPIETFVNYPFSTIRNGQYMFSFYHTKIQPPINVETIKSISLKVTNVSDKIVSYHLLEHLSPVTIDGNSVKHKLLLSGDGILYYEIINGVVKAPILLKEYDKISKETIIIGDFEIEIIEIDKG